jgi:hypothetical protein
MPGSRTNRFSAPGGDFRFRQSLLVLGLLLATVSLVALRGAFGVYLAPSGALVVAAVALVSSGAGITDNDCSVLGQVAFTVSLVALSASLIALLGIRIA